MLSMLQRSACCRPAEPLPLLIFFSHLHLPCCSEGWKLLFPKEGEGGPQARLFQGEPGCCVGRRLAGRSAEGSENQRQSERLWPWLLYPWTIIWRAESFCSWEMAPPC